MNFGFSAWMMPAAVQREFRDLELWFLPRPQSLLIPRLGIKRAPLVNMSLTDVGSSFDEHGIAHVEEFIQGSRTLGWNLGRPFVLECVTRRTAQHAV